MTTVARSFKLPFANGQVNLAFDKSVWPLDGHFTREMDSIVEAGLEMKPGATLDVGGTDVVFKASVTAQHQIELIWPEDEKERKRLERFGVMLDATDVGIRVMLLGKASAAATVKVPVGSVKLGFGAEGGGGFVYERFQAYNASDPIGSILLDALGQLRLPSQVKAADALPAAKEILTTKFSGYLTLSADASWGATITNSKGITAGDLALDFESKISLAATAAARYKLAGSFDLHCCRAGSRARFIATKSRESQFSFAADFRAVAKFKTEGLPENAHEFLGKLLGSDVDRVLRATDRVQKLESLDDLKEAVGELAANGLSKLSQPLIGKALDHSTVQEALKALKEVTGVYTSLDERVADLFRQGLEEGKPVLDALDTLISLESPESLKQVLDPKVWAIFKRLAGEKLYTVLLDKSGFDDVIGLAKSARTFIVDAPDRVKETVAALQREFALDGMIRKLESLSNAEALKTLADEQLRTLVSLLVDESFDKIAANVQPAFERLKKSLAAVDAFNAAWYEKVLEVANSSHEMNLNMAFSRATSEEALVDVELDLASEEGRTLAERAAVGDFAPVLARWNSAAVRIRDAALTRQVTRESQVRLNVLGFKMSSLSRLISRSNVAFRSLPHSGMVMVYTTEAELQDEKKRGNEQTASSFIVRAVAETQNPGDEATRKYLLSTLRSLSASYQLKRSDEETTLDELLEYLAFAESLGLLTDRAAFVAALQRELPGGWTRTSLDYVVRYDETALPAVFMRDSKEIAALARESMRSLIARVLIAQGPNLARTGLAYFSSEVRAEFEKDPRSFAAKTVSVTVPAWVTKDKAKMLPVLKEQMPFLALLFDIEKRYLRALTAFDQAVDTLRGGGTVAGERLTEIATDFVAFADDMPRDARINPFFGILDDLVLKTLPRGRKSALILELTPADGGEKVTKLLSA